MNVGTGNARPLRIHQAKSDLFHKGARLFDGPNGLAVETPLLAAQLLEFEISHKEAFELSALSFQLSQMHVFAAAIAES